MDEETTTLTLVVSASDADDSAPANTVTYAITSSTASKAIYAHQSSLFGQFYQPPVKKVE